MMNSKENKIERERERKARDMGPTMTTRQKLSGKVKRWKKEERSNLFRLLKLGPSLEEFNRGKTKWTWREEGINFVNKTKKYGNEELKTSTSKRSRLFITVKTKTRSDITNFSWFLLGFQRYFFIDCKSVSFSFNGDFHLWWAESKEQNGED